MLTLINLDSVDNLQCIEAHEHLPSVQSVSVAVIIVPGMSMAASGDTRPLALYSYF